MDVGVVLSALADPTRRAILSSVRHGPRSVGDIARDFKVSRPAVSQHLRMLSRAKLVRVHRVGRNNFYGLDLRGLTLLRGYVESFWDDVLDSFQSAAIMDAKKSRNG